MTNGEADSDGQAAFDYASHREQARVDYQAVHRRYEEFARVLGAILGMALERRELRTHSIQSRAKSVDSLVEKAGTRSADDPEQPKYPAPLTDIRDLAGARVITYFPRTVDEVSAAIEDEFVILERIDQVDSLEEDRLGYQSVHYLVQLSEEREHLPEYSQFAGMVAEIQVRTILQHAWAEIEHDIQYKTAATTPSEIRRRIAALAGLLEVADREFQGIADEDQRVREQARESLETGRLSEVEITADALKAYLDRKFGPDARVANWSYDVEARRLRRLGFSDFSQIDECIEGYDDSQISRILYGARQGQLTRFQDVLLAALGEAFLTALPKWTSRWYLDWRGRQLDKLREAGIEVGERSAPIGENESLTQ